MKANYIEWEAFPAKATLLKINNTPFNNINEYLYEQQQPVVNGSFLKAISNIYFHSHLCIFCYYLQ